MTTLTWDCPEPGHDRHYTMPGRCGNCGVSFTLSIPFGHRAPGSTLGWECSACGNRAVYAIRRPV